MGFGLMTHSNNATLRAVHTPSDRQVFRRKGPVQLQNGSLITDQTVVGLSLTLCSLEVISKGRGLVGGVVV